MIAYRISRPELEALIEAESPGWLQRATARTNTFRQLGHYAEASSIWSEVKGVYMRMQGQSKCAYCERKLESVEFGKVEQDVEHFRPKGSVREWKIPKELESQDIKATAAPGPGRGYFLLPYHPFNYSAACKPCNTALKKDHFPIAGNYDLTGDDPAALANEKPYLICPIGNFDDDPEDLIRFHGVSPQPTATTGHDRKRALVTIEFFKLDDGTKRKNLLRERAFVIVAMYPFLERLDSQASDVDKADARGIVDGLLSPSAPHTNCARSFKSLFVRDRAEAKAVFDAAARLVASIS